MSLSMKILKKRFGMTKEEVEENIRLLPYHRLYIQTMRDIVIARSNRDADAKSRLREIQRLRDILQGKWEELNGKIPRTSDD